MPIDPKHPLARLRRAIELIQRNPFKSSHLSEAEALLLGIEHDALPLLDDDDERAVLVRPTLAEWIHAGNNPARYQDAMRELDEKQRGRDARPRLPG